MSSKTSIVAAAALAVVSWGASAAIAAADPTPAPPGPAAPNAAGPKTSIDSDGVFIVGKDIAPGTYATAGPTDGHRCYWRRMNDPDPHAKNNVIDSALTAKPQVVLIDPTDKAFKTSGCQPWHVTDAAPDSTGPGPNISPQARAAMAILGGLGGLGGGPAPAPAPPAPAAPAPAP
ncbi:hypothetical protein FZI85_02080 [Mycobacterium sp. CBMA293]|uniref:hypothetical protein n=1 Tax=unclassified Mycolicibacterium TaxID=2636767 RepID=UPI0012DD2D3B|nr:MULTISPECIES: hypothetical protein [unclassified Mycolicibacterium]MUL44793.1 hypothetical protein [Mycolicibacterium sp. CBMA 360]MUL58098.1 hypothetical protein [Mycolicibacterium sp. CBMA 335]MUL73556.1 hypothetical protein [Mycolicibacterium sp. CBMA 311]MUL95386.1 hypothetical protein [Mycolicibacterium sp. CBMA 230]MUM07530.1 hypothetical protein [Mycolicibacterium sp. CBMA 213]